MIMVFRRGRGNGRSEGVIQRACLSFSGKERRETVHVVSHRAGTSACKCVRISCGDIDIAASKVSFLVTKGT